MGAGKRGRPPSNIRKYDVPTVDPNRIVQKPEEIGRISAK